MGEMCPVLILQFVGLSLGMLGLLYVCVCVCVCVFSHVFVHLAFRFLFDLFRFPPVAQNEIATVRAQWPSLLNAASLLLSPSSTSVQRLYRLTASLYPSPAAAATVSAAAAASAHASGTDIASGTLGQMRRQS
jgi:hypothetical protein